MKPPPPVSNFKLGLEVVLEPDPARKCDLAESLCRDVKALLSCPSQREALAEELLTETDRTSEDLNLLPAAPGRKESLHIVAQHEVPSRGSLRRLKGFSALMHALAHIELSAIEIASAQLFLYSHAPLVWIKDTAEILEQEIAHFKEISSALSQLGSQYGDLPVHDALWQTFLQGTTWEEHAALVNRHQEAAGVDASAHLLEQMEIALQEDPKGCAFLSAYRPLIEKLHREEIGHVAVGSRVWHRKDQNPESFFTLLEVRVRSPWSARQPLCELGRQRGGFHLEELDILRKKRLDWALKKTKNSV
jgi:uncharacterized ferritin-like protein (DUF455 family)